MVDVVRAMCSFLKSRSEITFPVRIGTRPRELDDCITLVPDSGSNSTSFFQTSSDLVYPMIFVYVRSKEYQPGFDQCSNLITVLKSFRDFSIGIRGVQLIGNISSTGKDDAGRQEFLVTFSSIAEE